MTSPKPEAGDPLSNDWTTLRDDFPPDNELAWRGDPFSLPIPNATMRAASSIGELESWYAIGEAWAQIAAGFLPPAPTVLDIGCGCGKLARFLYLHPDLQYIGVDLFLPAITWCRNSFKSLAGSRFRFEHFDGVSEVYNPGGTIPPSEYRLPVDDSSVDMTICASLFTHLLEPDCVHYLQEIYRVSRPCSMALISIHDEPAPGQCFSGDEARIDVDKEYFINLAADAGLSLRQPIGNVYGQEVFLFERKR